MKSVDRPKYAVYLKKGEQHMSAASSAMKEKSYDAAVTNYTIALINFMDALSVNRFGKDLSTDNHTAAPTNLYKLLNGIGVTDFKALSQECVQALQLKNQASYASDPVSQKDAKICEQTVKKLQSYIADKIDKRLR